MCDLLAPTGALIVIVCYRTYIGRPFFQIFSIPANIHSSMMRAHRERTKKETKERTKEKTKKREKERIKERTKDRTQERTQKRTLRAKSAHTLGTLCGRANAIFSLKESAAF